MPEPRSENRPQRTVVLEHDALRELDGFTQIPNVVLKHAGVSYGAKVAWGVLMSYAWQKDFCFPAQERLAKDMSCTVRQVQRLLGELRDAGFVTWKQQGLNRPNIYHLRIPARSAAVAAPSSTKIKDTTNLSSPETTHPSLLEATNPSPKVYEMKNTQSVNVKRSGTSEEDNEEAQRRELRSRALVLDILDVCKDRHSTGSYTQIARTYPEQLVREALSLTKGHAARGRIRKSKGAYFTDMVRRLARERGLNLPLHARKAA
jgi:hypothetical protein